MVERKEKWWGSLWVSASSSGVTGILPMTLDPGLDVSGSPVSASCSQEHRKSSGGFPGRGPSWGSTRPARCSTVCGLGHQETNCQRGRSPIPERGGKLRAASLRPSSVPFASVLYQVANGLRVRDQSASVSPWVSIPSYRTSVGIGREGLPLGHLLGPVTACCPKRQFLHPQH